MEQIGYGKITHTAHSAGTSSNEAVSANTSRSYLLLQNDSDTAVYAKFGSDAVVGEGIKISSGESVEFYNFIPTDSINTIHNGTGSKTLLVTEGEG